jgi:hypothetical protein
VDAHGFSGSLIIDNLLPKAIFRLIQTTTTPNGKVIGRLMVKLTSVNKIFFLLLGILSLLGVAAIDFPTVHAFASEKGYQRVVILGDPHLPGNNIVGKKGTLKDINAWSDVDMVAVVGDVCEDLGTRDEYAYAKEFFGGTQKPLSFIVGNSRLYL